MLKELKTLIAVSRHGTFSRAAESVGLTQSAVSAQIQRLEATLGFTLFDRKGRIASINAAGRETLERAEQLVALFDGLQRPQAADGATVSLRIGAIASVQSAALPEAIAMLRATIPTLRLRVVPGVSLALLGMIDSGELDAAIMIRSPFPLPPELAWRPLWSESFVLAVPAALRGRDWRRILSTHAFLRYDARSFGGRLVAQFIEAQGLVVDDVVEMDDIAGLIHLVAAGAGVALLPRCSPCFPPAGGVRIVNLGAASFAREIGMVERVRHPKEATVRALVDALVAVHRRPAPGRRNAAVSQVSSR